jgi:hypothetical protein
MRLTKKMLKRRFDKFNAKYFNNELFEPKFVKTGSRWTAGMFNCDVFVSTDYKGERYASKLGDIKIRLSKYLIKNPRILDNILLHEMIHYYGYLMNKDIDGTHGRYFKQMAKKINKDGYNIQKYYKEN